MKTTPIYGWPYPESADHTRTWEYWQNLANAIDTSMATNAVTYAVQQGDLPFSGTTYVDVPLLSLPVVANALYDATIQINYWSTTAADIKMRFVIPTGSGCRISFQYLCLDSTATTRTGPYVFTYYEQTTAPVEIIAGAIDGSILLPIRFFGTYWVGPTAGNIKLQVCQNVAGAANSATIRGGSSMRLQRAA